MIIQFYLIVPKTNFTYNDIKSSNQICKIIHHPELSPLLSSELCMMYGHQIVFYIPFNLLKDQQLPCGIIRIQYF